MHLLIIYTTECIIYKIMTLKSKPSNNNCYRPTFCRWMCWIWGLDDTSNFHNFKIRSLSPVIFGKMGVRYAHFRIVYNKTLYLKYLYPWNLIQKHNGKPNMWQTHKHTIWYFWIEFLGHHQFNTVSYCVYY